MLTEVLFSPSDFLIASAEPASRSADPFSNAMTAETPEIGKFSEYLAALDEKAGSGREEAPERNEEPSAAENETDDEENISAAESAAVENKYLAGTVGVAPNKAEAAADKADSGGTDSLKDAYTADGLLTGETAEVPVLRLTEAAPEAVGEGRRQAAEAANTEKKGAAGEPKPFPDGGGEKSKTAPEEYGGLKPFNASDGIYLDEKTPEIEARLAGDAGVEEAMPATAAFHSKKSAAGNTDGSNTAAPITDTYIGTTGVLARTAEREKSVPPMAKGEKKHTEERGRRHTAGERVEPGVHARGGVTEQAAPLREAVRVSAAPEAEITVNLRGGEPHSAAGERSGGGAGAASFETFLARELNQNLNGDIVRQAQVLLREGGEGTIRLSLKPESLGKVKIRLEMTENKITGKIVVESGEALRAFEHEMESLEQTFRGEGFDGASLSLELAEHEEPGGSEGEWRTGFGKISTKTASSRYDENANKGVYFGAEYSAIEINVLA